MLKFTAAVVAVIALLALSMLVLADPSDARHRTNGDYAGRILSDDSRFFPMQRYDGGIYSIWVTTRSGRHIHRGYTMDLTTRGLRIRNRRSASVKVYIQAYDDRYRG